MDLHSGVATEGIFRTDAAIVEAGEVLLRKMHELEMERRCSDQIFTQLDEMFEGHIQELTDMLNREKSRVKILEEKVSHLMQRNQELENKVNKTEIKDSEEHTEKRKLEDELEHTKRMLDKTTLILQEKEAIYMNKLKKMTEDFEHVVDLNQHLQASVNQAEEQQKRSNKKKMELEKTIKQQQDELHKLRAELDEKTAQMSQREAELVLQLEEKEHMVQEIQSELHELKIDYGSTSILNTSLKGDLEVLSEKLVKESKIEEDLVETMNNLNIWLDLQKNAAMKARKWSQKEAAKQLLELHELTNNLSNSIVRYTNQDSITTEYFEAKGEIIEPLASSALDSKLAKANSLLRAKNRYYLQENMIELQKNLAEFEQILLENGSTRIGVSQHAVEHLSNAVKKLTEDIENLSRGIKNKKNSKKVKKIAPNTSNTDLEKKLPEVVDEICANVLFKSKAQKMQYMKEKDQTIQQYKDKIAELLELLNNSTDNIQEDLDTKVKNMEHIVKLVEQMEEVMQAKEEEHFKCLREVQQLKNELKKKEAQLEHLEGQVKVAKVLGTMKSEMNTSRSAGDVSKKSIRFKV